MTKFVPLRDWSSKTGALLERLRTEDTLVVTQNGQPAAYVIRANPATLESDLAEIRRLRFSQATAAMRESAKRSGRGKLSMKEIDAIISQARKDRRARLAASS